MLHWLSNLHSLINTSHVENIHPCIIPIAFKSSVGMCKIGTLSKPGQECSIRSWREEAGCPGHVWILGVQGWKAEVNQVRWKWCERCPQLMRLFSKTWGPGPPSEECFWWPCLENYWLTCHSVLRNWFWVSAKFYSYTAVAFKYFTQWPMVTNTFDVMTQYMYSNI